MPADQAPKSINEILATNLDYFMKAKGLNQATLGSRADIGQTTISLYLKPKRRLEGKSGKEPSAKLAQVQRLADALEVELWELLRPLTPVQREFYRSMDALLKTHPATEQLAAPVDPPRKRRPPRAA